MKIKKTIVALVILAVGACFVWLAFFRQQTHQWYIKHEIAKANYCEVASDCRLVAQSQCPFGCHIHVNKNEAGRIEKLLENYKNTRYRTSCDYLCIKFAGVECVKNICQLVH